MTRQKSVARDDRETLKSSLRRSPRFQSLNKDEIFTLSLRRSSRLQNKTLIEKNPKPGNVSKIIRQEFKLKPHNDILPPISLRRSPRFRPKIDSETIVESSRKFNLRRRKEDNNGEMDLCRSPEFHSEKKEVTASNGKKVKNLLPSSLLSLDSVEIGGKRRNRHPFAPIDVLDANLSKEVEKDAQVVEGIDGGVIWVDDLLDVEEGQKKRETTMNVKDGKENKKKDVVECCNLEDWTKEQDRALHTAYLSAKPSPHFWKKVSIMVPGKTAQECFNRIHADLATPVQPEPRSRAKRMSFSPVGKLTFLDKSVDNQKKKLKTSRRKSLVAQKTVRKLLKKNSVMDQNQEADYFSLLETSASPLILKSSESKSIDTPSSAETPTGFLVKCSQKSLSGGKNLLSRFKSSQTDPSPEVLKQIKNIALHEKYIDRLHFREARRKASYQSKHSLGYSCNKISNNTKAAVMKAARASLVTSASEVINHFQNAQMNCLNDDDGSEMSTDSCDDNDSE